MEHPNACCSRTQSQTLVSLPAIWSRSAWAKVSEWRAVSFLPGFLYRDKNKRETLALHVMSPRALTSVRDRWCKLITRKKEKNPTSCWGVGEGGGLS